MSVVTVVQVPGASQQERGGEGSRTRRCDLQHRHPGRLRCHEVQWPAGALLLFTDAMHTIVFYAMLVGNTCRWLQCNCKVLTRHDVPAELPCMPDIDAFIHAEVSSSTGLALRSIICKILYRLRSCLGNIPLIIPVYRVQYTPWPALLITHQCQHGSSVWLVVWLCVTQQGPQADA